MATDNQLGMASGSKTFTALVVMCLVEEGLLSLATTARQVLGTDLPLIGDDVTVEHLLSHRSSIGDYLDEDELDSVSGGDAGVSFWSSHHPERGTTATVISTTMGGARPMAEVMKLSI